MLRIRDLEGWPCMIPLGLTAKLRDENVEVALSMDESASQVSPTINQSQLVSSVVDALLWEEIGMYEKLPVELDSQLVISFETDDQVLKDAQRGDWWQALLYHGPRSSVTYQRTPLKPPTGNSITIRLQAVLSKVSLSWQWLYLHRTLFDLLSRPISAFPARNLQKVRLEALTDTSLVLDWTIFFANGQAKELLEHIRNETDRNFENVAELLGFIHMDVMFKMFIAADVEIDAIWMKHKPKTMLRIDYREIRGYKLVKEMVDNFNLGSCQGESTPDDLELEEGAVKVKVTEADAFSTLGLSQSHDPWVILYGQRENKHCLGHGSYLARLPRLSPQAPFPCQLLSVLHFSRMISSLEAAQQSEHAVSVELKANEVPKVLKWLPLLIAEPANEILGLIVEALPRPNIRMSSSVDSGPEYKIHLWCLDGPSAASRLEWFAEQLGFPLSKFSIAPHSQAVSLLQHPNPPYGHWLAWLEGETERFFLGHYDTANVLRDALAWLQWLPEEGFSLDVRRYDTSIKDEECSWQPGDHQLQLTLKPSPLHAHLLLSEAVMLIY